MMRNDYDSKQNITLNTSDNMIFIETKWQIIRLNDIREFGVRGNDEHNYCIYAYTYCNDKKINVTEDVYKTREEAREDLLKLFNNIEEALSKKSILVKIN